MGPYLPQNTEPKSLQMEAEGYHSLNNTVMIRLFKEVEALGHKRNRQGSFSYYEGYFNLKENSMHTKSVQMHESSK